MIGVADSREFDLDHVLALTHGLPASGPDFKAILEYVSGAAVPSALSALPLRDPVRQWLLEQHPRLREVPAVPRSLLTDAATEAAMDAWAAEQKARLGETRLPIRPLPPDRRGFGSPLERSLDAAQAAGKLDTVYIQDPGGHGQAE